MVTIIFCIYYLIGITFNGYLLYHAAFTNKFENDKNYKELKLTLLAYQNLPYFNLLVFVVVIVSSIRMGFTWPYEVYDFIKTRKDR